MLFSTLKSQFEALGISAEFYTKWNYKTAKLSDHNMISDYIMELTNLAHIFNREIKGTIGHIEEQNIPLHILHDLPPCMRSIQTMILEMAPDSDKGEWDLSKLKQVISNDELWARAAGENLGTKLNLTSEPNALAVDG